MLSLIYGHSGRKYSENDLKLAEELGRRAGVAIENVRLYEQLQEADAKKDQFIATLAHELRNPLAPLLMRSELLQIHARENMGDPMLAETAKVIERQVKTMARLLDDLLDISLLIRGKISLKREQIEISEIVKRAVETTESVYKRLKIILHIGKIPRGIIVNVDPMRIEQVIVNLLTNAAKFNKKNGEVWLRVSKDKNSVAVSVIDNGLGINADTIPKIFDIFVQERSRNPEHGGLGIGLAIAKVFVEMHGGKLDVASDGVGKGSKFSVYLPIAGKEAAETKSKILVVDDNVDAVNALAEYLKYSGFDNVYIATSGEEAFRMGISLEPNVVLMDIRMPGMDGYQTASAMRHHPSFKQTTLIAVTGYGQEEDRKKAEEAGFKHHFVKPVDTKALISLLHLSA